MIVFDSNALLRYILQDQAEMANSVEEKIKTSTCYVPAEVVAEMVYVLSKVYEIPRKDISEALLTVLTIDSISVDSYEVLAKGLCTFAETKLDFVDCLMVGYHHSGYTVFSFDKELNKHLQKQ